MNPARFTELPGIGQVRKLGIQILIVIVMIDLLRETLKLVRGQSADFVGVGIRGVVSVVVIAGLPQLSLAVASASLEISEWLFGKGQLALMERSFAVAHQSVDCQDLSGWDVFYMLFSPAGMLWLLAQGLQIALLITKYFVIDVLWPIMFSLVVYLGVLSVPLTFFRELGGLEQYARNVLSVAMWPVVYAFVMILVASMFPNILGDVAKGKAAMSCSAAPALASSSPALSSSEERKVGVMTATVNAAAEAGKLLMKFLALTLGVIFLTLKTPLLASMMVGVQDPQGIGGQLSSLGHATSAQTRAGSKDLAGRGWSAGKAVNKWRKRR